MRKDAIEGTSGSVSSEEELRAALARGLTPITLTGCFSINGADSLVVDYNAEIIGGGHILTRGDRFTRVLFTVTDGGSLTLRDVVVDGSRDTAGRTNSLIRLNGGTLRLEEWTVLQNNFANGEGGGVYLNGGAATENHLFLTENAVIRHCEAGTAGGGIYASFRNRLPINLRGTDHIFPSRQKLIPAVKALPFPEPNHRKSVNVDYISFASNQYKSGSEYNVSHEHSDSQEKRIQIVFVFYH